LLVKAQFFRDDLLPFRGWLMASRSADSMSEEQNTFESDG